MVMSQLCEMFFAARRSEAVDIGRLVQETELSTE